MLDDHEFRLLDICTFIRRPVDDALWQIDAVFAKNKSALGDAAQGWLRQSPPLGFQGVSALRTRSKVALYS